MKIDQFNKWLVLAANLGVLIGIIFLAIEINQNTQTIQRDIALSQQSVIHGPFIDSSELARIQTQINEVQGNTAFVVELADTFNLTIEDAQIWSRYLLQLWQQNEANWHVVGDIESICTYGAALLGSMDNSIFWKHQKHRYAPGFVKCIEETDTPQMNIVIDEN